MDHAPVSPFNELGSGGYRDWLAGREQNPTLQGEGCVGGAEWKEDDIKGYARNCL